MEVIKSYDSKKNMQNQSISHLPKNIAKEQRPAKEERHKSRLKKTVF